MNNAQGKNTNALISAAAVVVIVFGMQAAKVLLVPFLLAVFLALIAVRPMLWLQQRRVPSVAAALLIVTAMMLVLVMVGRIVGTSIADFTAALPTYQARLDTIMRGSLEFVTRFIDDDRPITNFGELIDPGWAMGMAANILNALRDVLTNTFLILFTIVFILLEVSSLGIKVQAAFGRSAESFERPRQFLHNLGRYMGIKTAVSMATGLSASLLTWWVGLDFPLLWGMLAFLFNYVPAIGFLAINILFGNVIEPRLMGYGVGISPLIVFIGLVVWGWIFGPVGMLLSVPLTMTTKMALEADERTRWLAILIGSERDAEFALAQQHLDDEEERQSAAS